MWKKIAYYSVACVFVVLLFCSTAQQQKTAEMTLQETSSSIKSKLQYLKNESDNMIMQLTELSQELAQSEEQRKAQQAQLKILSDSSMNITQQLTSSYETINSLQYKIQQKNSILSTLIVILVLRISCMFVGFLFYIKGIKLPRWLDILL